MGRKSSLTPKQWIEVERRHLVDGPSFNKLAADSGVNESSNRRRMKLSKDAPEGKNKLQALAEEKVRADAASKRISEQIAQLPYANQTIVADLARKLANVSQHIGSTAEFSAASAHRLFCFIPDFPAAVTCSDTAPTARTSQVRSPLRRAS